MEESGPNRKLTRILYSYLHEVCEKKKVCALESPSVCLYLGKLVAVYNHFTFCRKTLRHNHLQAFFFRILGLRYNFKNNFSEKHYVILEGLLLSICGTGEGAWKLTEHLFCIRNLTFMTQPNSPPQAYDTISIIIILKRKMLTL